MARTTEVSSSGFASDDSIKEAAAQFRLALQKQSNIENNYLFHSFKAGKCIHVRGDVQFLHTLLDEFDPDVAWFDVEVPSIGDDGRSGGIGVRFDATVRYKSGRREEREYKRFEDHKKPSDEVRKQLAGQRSAARMRGAKFLLKDERELAHRIDECLNCLTLLGWRNRSKDSLTSSSEDSALDKLFEGATTVTLQEILDIGGVDQCILLGCLARRFAEGELHFNRSVLLTRATLISASAQRTQTAQPAPQREESVLLPVLPPRGDFGKVPLESLDMCRWPKPLASLIKDLDKYRNQEKAILLFYEGADDSAIKRQTGLTHKRVIKLILKCAELDEYGCPVGFVALSGFNRGYNRTAPLPEDNTVAPSNGGFAGAFTRLLEEFPELVDWLRDRTLEIKRSRSEIVAKRPTWSAITRSLGKVVKAKRAAANQDTDGYPSNTIDGGYVSVKLFCKSLLYGNALRYVGKRVGRESAHRMNIGGGDIRLVQPRAPLQIFALDFHKVDLFTSFSVTNPLLAPVDVVVPRWWIGRIQCCCTSITFADTMSLEFNTTTDCVLDLADAFFRPPSSRAAVTGNGDDSPGCWQPNQFLQELQHQGLDLLIMDHAWAQKAPDVVTKLVRVLGTVVCFAAVRRWDTKGGLERSFLETSRAVNTLPSSVGGSGKPDERRKSAGRRAVQLKISPDDAFDHICRHDRKELIRIGPAQMHSGPLPLLRANLANQQSTWVPRPVLKCWQDDCLFDWVELDAKVEAGSKTNPVSHRPHVRIRQVRFRGNRLRNEWALVKQPVLLCVGRRDFRQARVYEKGTGRLIDEVQPEEKWRRYPLSWRMFRTIEYHGRVNGKLQITDSPIEEFKQQREAEALKKIKRKRTRYKSTKAALVLAKLKAIVPKTGNGDQAYEEISESDAQTTSTVSGGALTTKLPTTLPKGFGSVFDQ